jgi:hypothetical protein
LADSIPAIKVNQNQHFRIDEKNDKTSISELPKQFTQELVSNHQIISKNGPLTPDFASACDARCPPRHLTWPLQHEKFTTMMASAAV